MNKIEYFRKKFMDLYKQNKLNEAADVGASMVQEYCHTQPGPTLAHADDLFNLAVLYQEMGEIDHAIDLYYEGGATDIDRIMVYAYAAAGGFPPHTSRETSP